MSQQLPADLRVNVGLPRRRVERQYVKLSDSSSTLIKASQSTAWQFGILDWTSKATLNRWQTQPTPAENTCLQSVSGGVRYLADLFRAKRSARRCTRVRFRALRFVYVFIRRSWTGRTEYQLLLMMASDLSVHRISRIHMKKKRFDINYDFYRASAYCCWRAILI